MTYLQTLAADVIEQNSQKLYAIIIIEVYSEKKISVTFKLKNLMKTVEFQTFVPLFKQIARTEGCEIWHS
jgi:hypothetical protein